MDAREIFGMMYVRPRYGVVFNGDCVLARRARIASRGTKLSDQSTVPSSNHRMASTGLSVNRTMTLSIEVVWKEDVFLRKVIDTDGTYVSRM